MPNPEQRNAAPSSAINSSNAYARSPNRTPNSRLSRCGAPVQCVLCRYRHKTHWSGAKHRLNRDFTGRFGSEAYAREELVAEMGSAFICASLGIVPTVRHADYVGNWLAVLKNDARAIVSAASHASKASDFLLAFTNTTSADAEEAA